jgi:hypothetical protein
MIIDDLDLVGVATMEKAVIARPSDRLSPPSIAEDSETEHLHSGILDPRLRGDDG